MYGYICVGCRHSSVKLSFVLLCLVFFSDNSLVEPLQLVTQFNISQNQLIMSMVRDQTKNDLCITDGNYFKNAGVLANKQAFSVQAYTLA